MRIILLHKIDQSRIVGKVGRRELRIAIESQALANSAGKTTHQEVGQKEGSWLDGHHLFERGATIHLIAVRPGDARHIVAFEDRVEPAGCATVAVDDDDAAKAWDQLAQPS